MEGTSKFVLWGIYGLFLAVRVVTLPLVAVRAVVNKVRGK